MRELYERNDMDAIQGGERTGGILRRWENFGKYDISCES